MQNRHTRHTFVLSTTPVHHLPCDNKHKLQQLSCMKTLLYLYLQKPEYVDETERRSVFTILKVHSFLTQFCFEIASIPKTCHTLWTLNQLCNSTSPVRIELHQHIPSLVKHGMIDSQPSGGYTSISNNNSDDNKKDMCKLPCPTLTVALQWRESGLYILIVCNLPTPQACLIATEESVHAQSSYSNLTHKFPQHSLFSPNQDSFHNLQSQSTEPNLACQKVFGVVARISQPLTCRSVPAVSSFEGNHQGSSHRAWMKSDLMDTGQYASMHKNQAH